MIAKYTAVALLGTALVSGVALAQSDTSPSPSMSNTASPTASIQQNLKGNWRASKMVGLAVYNDSNERLGDISELLIDNSGKINAVVIGVGGFLGVGQHDIAVSFDKLKWVNEPVRSASTTGSTPAAPGMSPSTSTGSSSSTVGSSNSSSGMTSSSSAGDNWYPDHAVMSGTKDELKALPAFKYSDYGSK